MSDSKKLVRKAVKMLTPLKVVADENIPWTVELKSGTTAALTQSFATRLSDSTAEWAYRLWERNMRESYAKSDWGFDEKEKRAELMATTSRYLIYSERKADSAEMTPIAYVHYRFDMDNGHPVVYCYELQVEATHQRNGLARHLVTMLEQMAKGTGMLKVVSTVFKSNEASNAFFASCGFAKDETDPSLFENGKGVDYNIYSKACK